jgi:hypothetical protein
MKPLFLLVLATFPAFTLSAQKGGIKYENRTDILHADDCNASEVYLKKKIKAQLANYYADYPYIYVDFTSFKGQNGFNDKTNPRKIVYPYKIEMLVYLKRTIMKEGKEKTESITWKYDSVYEYATLPEKKCEFRIVPSSQITRISDKVF